MDGWSSLGNVLGGGIDREGAFQEGRLRTAQTEDALMRARERQLDITAKEQQRQAMVDLEKRMADSGVPRPGLAYGLMAAGGGNAQQLSEALLGSQEFDLRDVAANPESDALTRTRALGAVAGKPYSDLEALGAGGVTNLTADVPAVDLTPLGESMVMENEASAGASRALEGLRLEQTRNPAAFRASGAATPGGLPNPPSGYIANPQFNPDMPVGDGNYPFIDARQPVMGSRETAMFNRVAGSAAAVSADMANLAKMPFATTNTGVLGIGQGAGPAVSIADAVAGNLKYQIAPEAVRDYNVMLGGMNRALSLIEGQGLQGSNALALSYDTLQLRPGDTIENAMFKMAQTRQTVEQGLVPHINSPRVPRGVRQKLVNIIDSLEQSVPWSVQDVIALRLSNDPNATIGSLAAQRLGQPAPGAAPAPAEPDPIASLPPVDERGWTLMQDDQGNLAYVGPNGEFEEVAQ